MWLENPPIQDPWRTREEYNDEQKRSRRLYIVASVSIAVSALATVGTAVGAVAALRSQTPQTVRVECIAPPSSAVRPVGVGPSACLDEVENLQGERIPIQQQGIKSAMNDLPSANGRGDAEHERRIGSDESVNLLADAVLI